MNLPDPGLSRAVLIGTGSYADEKLAPLPAVRNNVGELAAALADPALWGLQPGHCGQLLDSDEPSEVARVLFRMADEAEDTLIVYFTGHGLVDPVNGDLVLATHKTAVDIPRQTGLAYEWIREIVGRCRARRRIIVLDCCFSGLAVNAMADPASIINGQIAIEGTFILAAAPANSPAMAPEGSRHTAFTGGLLSTLRTGIPDGATFITLDDIYKQTLMAMLYGGWPRPQRRDTNGIGELPVMRNIWRDLGKVIPKRRGGRPAKTTDITVGVQIGVAAVRPTLGPAGLDSLTVLDETIRKCDERHRAGIGLVREVMEAMRHDYGDGAATAAIVTGELIAGVNESVEAGADLDTVIVGIERQAGLILRQLATLAQVDRCGDRIGSAVSTALGAAEAATLIVAAVSRVGASNVEIAPAESPEPELAFVGRLSFSTAILAPNSSTSPITLVDPYVVVSPNGNLVISDLLEVARRSPGPLLIVTPRISIITLRSLLHSFADTVVAVRPAQNRVDWETLGRRIGGRATSGYPCGKARQALISASSTTIIGLAEDQHPEGGRIRVHVGGPDIAAGISIAARALAVARTVTSSGVVLGGGAALFHASRAIGGAIPRTPGAKSTDVRGADVLGRALARPLRQLVRNAGRDADAVCAVLERDTDASVGFEFASGSIVAMCEAGIVDPLATVKGTVEHAVATVARYLAVS